MVWGCHIPHGRIYLLLSLLDNRARLPDLQLALAGSSGEAGRSGVGCSAQQCCQHVTIHPCCYSGLTECHGVVRPNKGVPSAVWQLQDGISKASLPWDVPGAGGEDCSCGFPSPHTLPVGREEEAECRGGFTPAWGNATLLLGPDTVSPSTLWIFMGRDGPYHYRQQLEVTNRSH